MGTDIVGMSAFAHVLGRGMVLNIAAIGGVLSIYWGWRLYRDGLASAVSAELTTKDSSKFKMRAVGPGVFFALFGMVLLVYLVRQSIDVVVTQPAELPAATPTTMPTPTDASLFLAQARGVPTAGARPSGPCLVRQTRIRGSDGRRLTRERIRRDLGEALRLLGRQDRTKLSPGDRAALNDAQDTIGEIIAGAAG